MAGILDSGSLWNIRYHCVKGGIRELLAKRRWWRPLANSFALAEVPAGYDCFSSFKHVYWPKRLHVPVQRKFYGNCSKNDCDRIDMASRPWANFWGPMRKIYKDFEQEPNFWSLALILTYKNEKCCVHINAYNSYPAPGLIRKNRTKLYCWIKIWTTTKSATMKSDFWKLYKTVQLTVLFFWLVAQL